MFYLNTTQSYVCPLLNSKKRKQISFAPNRFFSQVKEGIFFQMVIKMTLFFVVGVVAAQLLLGASIKNIEKSIQLYEHEVSALVVENNGLVKKQTFLLSNERIQKVAAEKLELFAAVGEQHTYIK